MPYSYAKLSKDQMYSIVFNERSNLSLVISHVIYNCSVGQAPEFRLQENFVETNNKS